MDFDSDDLSLGAIEEEFSLGNPENETARRENGARISQEIEKNTEIRSRPQNRNQISDDVESIYESLKISERGNRDFKEFFASNPEIFTIAETEYYESLSPEKYGKFVEKCTKLSKKANEKWHSQREKIEEFDEALGVLKSIFRTKKATEDFSAKIRQTLSGHLASLLKQKIKNKNLEITDINELYEFAVSIHLLTNLFSAKKNLLDWLKRASKKLNFKIETFSETFENFIEGKQKIERLDTEKCKQKIFSEYKKLAILNGQIYETSLPASDDELYEEMCKILAEKNFLVNNVDFYAENFFEKEKEKGEYNFSLPLATSYFYYLEETAFHQYEFSEDQWNDFVLKENLKKDTDATVAFIMGSQKASSISEIASLLEKNPTMALSRILAGDLETYLRHIGQIEMAKRLAFLTEEEKNDRNILLFSAINLLRGIDPTKETKKSEENSSDILAPLIERNASIQEIVSYLLRRKQFENLNKKILDSSATDHIELENYLLSKGFSFVKICMNYLHEFKKENNATVYKNMYETYATFVLEKLVAENDCLSFMCIFKPILEESEGENLLSEDFLRNYSEIENFVQEKFSEEEKAYSQKSTEKPKKSFFSFRR